MKRLWQFGALVVLAAVALGCGGNSTLNEDKPTVYLAVEITEYNPDISISQSADVTITNMSIKSFLKNPAGGPSNAQDVRLTRWVVDPYRTDGGTVASPRWVHDIDVYVAAGGEASLENYRVYPAEYFRHAPLVYLFPENGGVDPETGQTNIRQTLKIEIFGTTMGGKSISVVTRVAFNFFY